MAWLVTMVSQGGKTTSGAKRKAELTAGLYIVATPIGNLKDITYRAVEVLKSADAIACEDTRHTAKLCEAYGISTPRLAYHDHNGAHIRPHILERLESGQAIALVSDGGTPLISDPGYKLVRDAHLADIPVKTIPGASAAIAALSIAGLASDQFLFAGFAPAKSGQRTSYFEKLKEIQATLIFYEAPSRVAQTLQAMAKSFGARDVVVARELTKTYETQVKGNLSDLDPLMEAITFKGEFVILIAPPQSVTASQEVIDAMLLTHLEKMSVKEAASETAKALNMPRREAYGRALALKKTDS